jgi:glycosyltransferase involved in cell wall biosynthesis
MDNIRKVFAIVPIMAESAYLPTLLACLAKQDYPHFEVFFCVNQPEVFREKSDKQWIVDDNQKCLELLNQDLGFEFKVIDHASKHLGWDKKNYGVGWARKVPMDLASQLGNDNDLIVSLDADSEYEPQFFSSIVAAINNFQGIAGISVPYYHKLTGNEVIDRNMLRYEFYMRNYSLNMLRIGNPYAFTAIGSGMACTISKYNKVNGITPHKSGEDFYFILKLCKSGSLLRWNSHHVFPAARYSDRVFFGTGPALIKGSYGNWSSYPIYPYHLFDKVKASFDSFNELYYTDIDYPMKNYLIGSFNDPEWWIPLRQNSSNQTSFVKACRIKVDALRILQYLKSNCPTEGTTDENTLKNFISTFYPQFTEPFIFADSFNFQEQNIIDLNLLRDFLATTENNILVNNPLTSL